MRRRPTIRDVSRLAGVSRMTVSRVVRDLDLVLPQTRDRVNKAIADLGYSPNTHARTLVSGRSHIIGLMVTEITNPFFPELIQRFEQFAVESGYEVLLASTPNDAASIAMSVRRMLRTGKIGLKLRSRVRDVSPSSVSGVSMSQASPEPLTMRATDKADSARMAAGERYTASSRFSLAHLSCP